MKKKKPVKTATFNGRTYRINTDVIHGIVDQYALNERFVHIFTELNTQQGLITAIHEALHAENWAASEEVVERVSTEIGRFLWRLGYRIKE